jgi:two-component system, cell cycle response regulator DivK
MKILIIEDNSANMMLASDILKREGYIILQAADAELGIQMAQKQKPDLILMDIQLPKMDGLTATRFLKTNETLKHIPVIALTAHAMKDDGANILSAGCDSYITKPIRYKSFIQQINQLLSK